MNLNTDERETIVNASDGDDTVHIWTAQRTALTRLRRNPAFTQVDTGHHGSTEWAEFTIPADRWNPASGAKRRQRPMTDEQRAVAAARMDASLGRTAQNRPDSWADHRSGTSNPPPGVPEQGSAPDRPGNPAQDVTP